ncbi:hypothetical protein GCM10007884_22100 [Methylobacterium brachythecii]|uniref:Uncharacterized protein n=1 Tax=Methylobacterium brachythecii TaxID=1176177 RepID=A0ABQ6D7T2_9HYPH|nr:hypothetical protein GCM10007884_22100 [Methylobacterium brachythecii]
MHEVKQRVGSAEISDKLFFVSNEGVPVAAKTTAGLYKRIEPEFCLFQIGTIFVLDVAQI